jgi:hypothetical protein
LLNQSQHVGRTCFGRSRWAKLPFLCSLGLGAFLLGPAAPAGALPLKAPVAAYSFDEDRGETAYDSARTHDGNVSGAEWTEAGKFGSALKFDGEPEECVRINDSLDLGLSEEFTFDAWVKPEGSDESGPVIFKPGEGFPFNYMLSLGLLNGENLPEGAVTSADEEEERDTLEVHGGEAAPTGAWSSLALTYDGEELRLYRDGELVDSAEGLNEATEAPGWAGLLIGCSGSMENGFSGLIDNVRIYSRALDEEELKEDEETEVGEAPWFSEDPEIVGEAEEGELLGVDLTALHGAEPMSTDYLWERCSRICERISGADSAKYVPGAADAASQLRVRVTAKNHMGKTSSFTIPTGFIASAKTIGKPVLSAPPQIGGLTRVSEEVAAIVGKWGGEQPVNTVMTWELCDVSGELCEAIPSATEETYQLTPSDEGHRLRVRIDASNETGSESETSQLSDVIQPQNNTTFTFEPGVDLTQVDEAIQEGEMELLSVAYGDEEASGVYKVPAGKASVVEALSKALGESAGSLGVSTIEMRGSVKSESLGSLAKNVHSREVGPSLRRAKRNEPESTPIKSLQDFTDGAVRSSLLAGFENTNGATAVNGFRILSGFDRAVYSYFAWAPSLEEMLTEIYTSGSALAMEYDVRQVNRGNTDTSIQIEHLPSFQITCAPWQENNFWLGTREPSRIESNIPLNAGLYWDTGAEDPCTVKDLTYGIYHPEALEAGEEYTTVVYFDGGDADGDVDRSPIEWSIQILGEHCDHSPWCVNIPIEDIDGATSSIISGSDSFMFPRPGPASFPGCYRYWNPLYEGSPYVKPGAHPCIDES